MRSSGGSGRAGMGLSLDLKARDLTMADFFNCTQAYTNAQISQDVNNTCDFANLKPEFAGP